MERDIKDKHVRFTVILLLVLDILVILASGAFALLVRYEFDVWRIRTVYIDSYYRYMPINIFCTLFLFYVLHMYSSLWRYASVREFCSLALGSLASGVLQVFGAHFLMHLVIPRSYFVLYVMTLFLLEFLIRFIYRFVRFVRSGWESSASRVMVIGAGDAGAAIINEMRTSRHLSEKVCCVIDDDPLKKNRFLEGCRIVGGRECILKSVKDYDIQKIIIAIPSATKKTIRELADICQETSCALLTLPGTYQLVNGEVSVAQLREVDITDLLGREVVQGENEEVFRMIKGSVILVTGGGGSIGSELCRQIADHEPARLIVFDIYENNAYDLQQELIRSHPELDLIMQIGSVQNENRVRSIMETWRPDVVYHAAAHKHVPLMEDSPNEAIKNNVMGTYKTAVAAADAGVKKFVLISTDKAVNPTNIMGASKRMCEMIFQMMSRRQTRTEFAAIRFGNVLGSNGSVIPLFKKQIAAGGPVTVTDKNITRYFMTIPEAVFLVLQASYHAKSGEIYVLDMGEPVRIDDMARKLIRLSGFVPDVDIPIVYTGLRPGEKLYEELLMEGERRTGTEDERFYIGRPIEMDDEWFETKLKQLGRAVKEETEEVRELVAEIVPTYQYHKKATPQVTQQVTQKVTQQMIQQVTQQMTQQGAEI